MRDGLANHRRDSDPNLGRILGLGRNKSIAANGIRWLRGGSWRLRDLRIVEHLNS
jgi:hypothetical protein